MLLDDEIAEERQVHGVEVEVPGGYAKVLTAYKTIPLPVWELHTSDGIVLECSHHHLLATSTGLVKACYLTPGRELVSSSGTVYVVSSEDTGRVEPLYDITVDREDGLFYSNGLLSHNSTTFCSRQLMHSCLLPGYRALYLTPYFEQLKTYADRLIDMEGQVRYDVGKQNKYVKHYVNGSKLWLSYACESADHVRGKTVSEVLLDEIQNLNPDLVPEILKTQQMSKTPMTVYSGTALTTDTLLEQRWLMSSQGCYHVRSADGKHWINLHDPEELWKVTDNREYPIDYYTGKPLNVTDGVFVHANQDALADGDIGLHIPMIVVPSNCRGTQWAQIYKDVKTQPPAKTLQENFGIAIGDGAKEISEADLKAICVLRHTPQELAGKLATGYYRLVVMGCDWGGSDYNPATKSKQSYSVCCVLGLAPDGKLDILHAKKYAGMDYTVIIGDMLKAYRDYKCNAIASDYGMGAVYTMLIRQHVPWQRHFIMQYAAPNCAAFQAVAGSELPNHYSVNKTEAVTNTFISVREGGLRAKSWEDMSYYLTDFLAVHREMNDTPTGKRQFKWNRDPRKPDDFLHAVSFAMTLVKVYTGERVVADPSLLRQIRNTLNGRQAGPDLAGIPPVISG